jgi:succinyl-CoA synthetase alpha subunit
MSILIDDSTTVLIQGITSRLGQLHCQQMLAYGTKVTGGVAPGKAGQSVCDVPVFNTVKSAVEATGATASIVLVPPPFAADAIMESADSGIKLAAAITDGIPAQDMIKVKRYMRRYRAADRMTLLGPNCAGIISPGKSLLGIMPPDIYEVGNVGIISRSGTLGYEAASQMKAQGIGVSTSVGLGSDLISGSSYVDMLKLFTNDDETKAIVMVGERGGPQETEAAHFIHQHFDKPVVAYIAGTGLPSHRSMGHAGAIMSAFGDSADEKLEILRDCGVSIVEKPSTIGNAVADVLKIC